MSSLDETIRQILALPREAGTEGAARARELVAGYLTSLGYHVTLQRFTFTPASLSAFPLFGAGLGWLTVVLTPLLILDGPPNWAALAAWLLGLAALVPLVAGVGLGWVPLGGGSREDANLIAVRGDVPVVGVSVGGVARREVPPDGGAPVRRWIVAHLDTKAQGHSMAGRLIAVWAVALAIVALTVLAGLRLRGPVPVPLAAGGAAVALVAGVLAGRGRLRGVSQGARDNGSGIAAALAAAEASTDPGVGIVITGAEEFGLVGARIFAQLERERLGGVEVVNVDTIDDEGVLSLVSHDAAGEQLARTEGVRLAPIGLPVRLRRLPVGIFVDSLPLARAGAAAITIGRLTWRTLRTIHTPRDTPDGFSLETAVRVGRSLAGGVGRAPA